jgi:hypothetical protein
MSGFRVIIAGLENAIFKFNIAATHANGVVLPAMLSTCISGYSTYVSSAWIILHNMRRVKIFSCHFRFIFSFFKNLVNAYIKWLYKIFKEKKIFFFPNKMTF